MKPISGQAIALAAVVALLPGAAQAAWRVELLTSFTGSNGEFPQAALIRDTAGNLYGTTVSGGNFGQGTVFKLVPPAAGATAWTETVLASFTGTKGKSPFARLIFDAAGNLYGTTDAGGKYDDGTIFELSPPATGKTAWTETILASFNGTNGAHPFGSLIFDAAGNLYGTTTQGGAGSNGGTVFKLAPPAAGQTAWTETVLASFAKPGGTDPEAGVIFDKKGNLYGTTTSGGQGGTVFELSPPAAGQTAWTQRFLVSLDSTTGFNPRAALIRDAAGNLFGTTQFGGAFSGGTVFELSPPATGQTAWSLTVLVSFDATTGGYDSWAPLIFGAAGNLFGTTIYGGSAEAGTVFELTPPASGQTTWTQTTLASLTGTNGSNPAAGLIFDKEGNLYTTAYYGGSSPSTADGTAVKLTPLH